MVEIETLAKELKTTPQTLIKEGILAYLQSQLNFVSIEIATLKKKWNVKSLDDFDKAIKNGRIHEFSRGRDASEDFFRFSYLEQKGKQLLKLIKKYES